MPTPLPLAYLERRERGLVAESYFISARIDDAREVRDLLRTLPPEDLSRLLAALARFLVFAHNQGILHRDLSDGNLLVRSSRPGAYDLFLIDTNRIRVRREVSLLGRVRNLVRLGVPPSYQDDFLRLYLGDRRCGLRPPSLVPLEQAMVYRLRGLQESAPAEEAGRAAGDPVT